VRLFSNRSQMTSKCGRNKEVAHAPQASASLMFLAYLTYSVIYYWTDLRQHRNKENNCFIAKLHERVATYLRKCGNLPIREILVITWPYSKWVQVVQTAPEELGAFKKYAKARGRGQEKNRADVDLCKLSDLVVTFGPKLREVYCSYLRFCKKHYLPAYCGYLPWIFSAGTSYTGGREV